MSNPGPASSSTANTTQLMGAPGIVAATYANDVNGNIAGISVNGVNALPFVTGLSTANTAATATTNTAELQTAMNAGGLVQILTPGTFYINSTLTIYPNTNFVLARGVVLKLFAGSNCNMIRNRSWSSARTAVTVLSTPDSGITIQATSASLPAVGSYVIVLGASPRVYNGCYRVLTSGAGVFTGAMSTRVAPAETPATPATGTITWMQADENIRIEGEFDYDGVNQSASNWQTFGIYLRRLYNFRSDTTIRNATKYALALGNIYASSVDRAAFQTNSDGVHIMGSWDDLNIGTVQGVTGDDMVAAGNSDYSVYIDSDHMNGDGGTLNVGTILCDGSLTAFKYYGATGFVAKSIVVGNIQGRTSGGSGYVNLINDPGALLGTASTLENFELGSLTPTEAISVAGVQVSGVITIGSMKIGALRVSVNNNANARPVLIAASAIVTSLHIDDLQITSAAYTPSSFGVYIIGTVTDFIIGNFYIKNAGIAFFSAGSAGAGRLSVGNWDTINCGQAYKTVSANSQELFIGNIMRNGYQSSPHIELSNSAGGTTFRCATATGMISSDAFGGSGGNKNVTYAPQIGIDVGTLGRTVNCMCVHIGTRGTLVSGNMVICDATGATNSWKQVSNTANTY